MSCVFVSFKPVRNKFGMQLGVCVCVSMVEFHVVLRVVIGDSVI